MIRDGGNAFRGEESQQRRRCARRKVRGVRVRCDTPSFIQTYQVADVSATGLRIRNGLPLRPGEPVYGWLRSHKWLGGLAFRATVVWDRASRGESGLVFKSLDSAELARLDVICAEPLSRPGHALKPPCRACGHPVHEATDSGMRLCTKCLERPHELD